MQEVSLDRVPQARASSEVVPVQSSLRVKLSTLLASIYPDRNAPELTGQILEAF
jgi:hypothetical protein